jgi:hypothetical protein
VKVARSVLNGSSGKRFLVRPLTVRSLLEMVLRSCANSYLDREGDLKTPLGLRLSLLNNLLKLVLAYAGEKPEKKDIAKAMSFFY